MVEYQTPKIFQVTIVIVINNRCLAGLINSHICFPLMITYHKILWWLYNWLPWLTIINSHLFLHWLCDLATHLNLRKWHQSWWFSQRVVNNQIDFFIAPPPCLGHSAGRAWMSSPFCRLDPIGRHTLPLSPKSRSEERVSIEITNDIIKDDHPQLSVAFHLLWHEGAFFLGLLGTFPLGNL